MNGEVLVEQTGRRSAGDSEAKSLQDSSRPSPVLGGPSSQSQLDTQQRDQSATPRSSGGQQRALQT